MPFHPSQLESPSQATTLHPAYPDTYHTYPVWYGTSPILRSHLALYYLSIASSVPSQFVHFCLTKDLGQILPISSDASML